MDLLVAFNSIDHDLFLGGLSRMGLEGHYFTGAMVIPERKNSKGGARGFLFTTQDTSLWFASTSLLSPMLFNIYMKPLVEVVWGFGV